MLVYLNFRKIFEQIVFICAVCIRYIGPSKSFETSIFYYIINPNGNKCISYTEHDIEFKPESHPSFEKTLE